MKKERLKEIKKRYTDITDCVIDGGAPGWNVWLKVNSQKFCVTSFAAETQEEAESIQDMLGKAVLSLLDAEVEKNA